MNLIDLNFNYSYLAFQSCEGSWLRSLYDLEYLAEGLGCSPQSNPIGFDWIPAAALLESKQDFSNSMD